MICLRLIATLLKHAIFILTQPCRLDLNIKIINLEAFAVNDSGAGFIVLLLRDPHLLEGRQGSQDGASDPDGVLPLGRSDDLDLHGGRSQGGDLLLHTIRDTGVHGRATGQDGVGVQILAKIDVRLHD